jgi:exonuclease III
MAYMKPGAFKAIANRRRQWSLLGALAPDVALLQECRPGDRVEHAPTWMAEGYVALGAIPPRWVACSAVVARRELNPIELDRTRLPEPERRWLEYLSGYVATGNITLDAQSVAVASVHAIAMEVDAPSVLDTEHERIRRRVLRRAWHNDLAAAALAPWVEAGRFVVGGDWNNAILFDSNYPAGAEGGPGASTEFFAARTTHGWQHALRKFSDAEVRTYLDPKSAPYELDHLFTDAELHKRLTNCSVLDDKAITELSDHAPVVAEFATG